MAGRRKQRRTEQPEETRRPHKDYSGRYPGAERVETPGDWTEWEQEGQEVVGVYKGTEPFRNGFKTTMDTPKGPVIFSTPKLLKAALDNVEIGTRIAIVYLGRGRDTGKGEPLKEFDVYRMKDGR